MPPVRLVVTAICAALAVLAARPAHAEIQFSVYGGMQGANGSRVSGNDPAGAGAFDFNQRWEGNSLTSSPYWGARATWWLDGRPNWGVAFDYTHAKVYASPLPAGWQTLEFSDGLNIFTANLMHRFRHEGRAWTPYVGVGAGISMPHVEVRTSPAAPLTFSYQVAGLALGAQVGVEYRFTRYLSAFTEYKINHTQNRGRLAGGGWIHTDILTHAVNVGLSLHWE